MTWTMTIESLPDGSFTATSDTGETAQGSTAFEATEILFALLHIPIPPKIYRLPKSDHPLLAGFGLLSNHPMWEDVQNEIAENRRIQDQKEGIVTGETSIISK